MKPAHLSLLLIAVTKTKAYRVWNGTHSEVARKGDCVYRVRWGQAVNFHLEADAAWTAVKATGRRSNMMKCSHGCGCILLICQFTLSLSLFQKRHALRCYCQALQVYKGKGWSLAEDHINFTIGRQSFTLRQPENAVAAFRHILINDSKQSAVQQAAFLREYLYVFKVSNTHGYHILSRWNQNGP